MCIGGKIRAVSVSQAGPPVLVFLPASRGGVLQIPNRRREEGEEGLGGTTTAIHSTPRTSGSAAGGERVT